MIMKGMSWYYVTRLALVAVWLLLSLVAGLPVWLSLLTGAALIAYFVWLPRSGRYLVRQDRPVAPIRRDERSQDISHRAATWALVVETLLAAAGVVCGTLSHRQEVAGWLGPVLGAGMVTYLVATGWLGSRS